MTLKYPIGTYCHPGRFAVLPHSPLMVVVPVVARGICHRVVHDIRANALRGHDGRVREDDVRRPRIVHSHHVWLARWERLRRVKRGALC